MDFFAERRHRRLEQRHVVLEADQAAEHPERRLEDAQVAAVAPAPEDALLVGRHQLAVPPQDLAVRAEEDHGVVERPRAGPVVLLVDADHRGEPGGARRLPQDFGLRSGNPHRLVVERGHRLLPLRRRLRVGVPEVAPPVRIHRDPGLRGDDQVHSPPAGFEEGLGVLLGAPLLVQEHRADLRRAGAEPRLPVRLAEGLPVRLAEGLPVRPAGRLPVSALAHAAPPPADEAAFRAARGAPGSVSCQWLGQVQTRFRSPAALSTRETGGQYLCSTVHGAGNAASRRE